MATQRPFLGLRPFEYSDREFFFGREEQIFALYRLIDRSRFVAVVGSSGSGKSSLVRAGLLTLLDEESGEEGFRTWTRRVIRPGSRPIATLAKELATLTFDEDPAIAEARRERVEFDLRRSSFGLAEVLSKAPELDSKALLLVVDQFEELFRYAARDASPTGESEPALSRDEAAQFVQLLIEGARASTREIHVVITMRSDFIGDCARFHGLPEAVSGAQFLVPALTRDQLEEAIIQPLAKFSSSIEPALVERLLNDCNDDRDQLPVLQHCLLRLWEVAGNKSAGRGADVKPGAAQGARRLTMRHYEMIGGLHGALSRHAEEILAELPGFELAVEQTFRALSEMDREGRAVRRAMPFSQLLAETGVRETDLRNVLERFRRDDCSFLTTSPPDTQTIATDTLIDVGHEALLWRWERMSGGANLPGSVRGQADQGWLADEEEDGLLYRGLLTLLDQPGGETPTLPLRQVKARWRWWTSRPRTAAWAARYGGKFIEVQRLFDASILALDAERARGEREQKLLYVAAIGIGIFVGVICYSLVLLYKINLQKEQAYLTNLRRLVDIAALINEEKKKGNVTAFGHAHLLEELGKSSSELQEMSGSLEARALRTELELQVFDGYYNLNDVRSRERLRDVANSIDYASRKLILEDPDRKRSRQLRYESLSRLGDLHDRQKEFDDALQSYKAAFELASMIGAGSKNSIYIEKKIAEFFNEHKKAAEAAEYFKSVIRDANKFISTHPNTPDARDVSRYLATALSNYSGVLTKLTPSNPAAAIDASNEAIAVLKGLVDQAPSDESLKSNLAEAHSRKAAVLRLTDNGRQMAIAELLTAIAMREPLINHSSGSYIGMTYQARDYRILAELYHLLGEYLNEVASLRQEVGCRQKLVDWEPNDADRRNKRDDAKNRLSDAENVLRNASRAKAALLPAAKP